jgi:diguanylate cyclase
MERQGIIVTQAESVHAMRGAEEDDVALDHARRFARTGFPQRAYETALPVLGRARDRGTPRLIAQAAQILAAACLMMGKCEAGITYGREARSLFASLGDLAQAARSGANLAWLLAMIGEQDAVGEALAALDAAEQSADPKEGIWALDTNAIVFWLLRQHDQALPYAERAVELSRMHRPRLQRPLINLAGIRMEIALQSGATGEALAKAVNGAIALTSEALTFSRAVGDGWLERLALCNIAEYRLHVGDAEGAERALSQIPSSAGEMSDRCTYHYLHMLGRVRAAQDRPREAIDLLEDCLQVAIRASDLETSIPCQKDIAELHAQLGNFEAAYQGYRAFHELYVRQASHAAQRRARLTTLEWEAERLRASVLAAHKHAADLTASNRVLARETERLLRTSMEDPLTGLQNRRQLDLTFLDLIGSGKAYAIAMIDVDKFKQVNDGYSHPVGDAVLRAVADLLRHNARAGDLTVRFGGDEFSILLHEADQHAAVAVCERLRAGAALSIGVASSDEADTQEAVLALADQRLYRAKQEGRNRIVAG